VLIEVDQARSVHAWGGGGNWGEYGHATDRACLEKGMVGNSEGYL
jgi:hypothetical protein